MFYQEANSKSKLLNKLISFVKETINLFQKSMEAAAYSRILSQHGHQLTKEQRECIRQSLIDTINRK